MKEYGILLINRDDGKKAGLIKIDPSGVLIVSGGEEKWDYGIFKNAMSAINAVALPEALYKKHKDIKEKEGQLPERIIIEEIMLMVELINKSDISILQHPIRSLPIVMEDGRAKLLSLK